MSISMEAVQLFRVCGEGIPGAEQQRGTVMTQGQKRICGGSGRAGGADSGEAGGPAIVGAMGGGGRWWHAIWWIKRLWWHLPVGRKEEEILSQFRILPLFPIAAAVAATPLSPLGARPLAATYLPA